MKTQKPAGHPNPKSCATSPPYRSIKDHSMLSSLLHIMGSRDPVVNIVELSPFKLQSRATSPPIAPSWTGA